LIVILIITILFSYREAIENHYAKSLASLASSIYANQEEG